jgi:hypothetical protein
MYHVLETSCVTDTGLSKSVPPTAEAAERPGHRPEGDVRTRCRRRPPPGEAGEGDRIPEAIRVNNRRTGMTRPAIDRAVFDRARRQIQRVDR